MITTGQHNIIIGYKAGRSILTGSYNTILGSLRNKKRMTKINKLYEKVLNKNVVTKED